MKIGLVRHFKVKHPFPKKTLLSKSEVINWFNEYDNNINIEYKKVDLLQINWERCYSSPMIRALKTASHIYPGEILEVKELKELEILGRLSNRLKLPFIIWGIIVRVNFFISNNDTRKFKDGLIGFVDKLIRKDKNNTLIVSHWFVMQVIEKELIRRGFTGNNFKPNKYGRVSVFENKPKK